MSSMPRYKLKGCYPSYRHHSWEKISRDKDGCVNKIRCIHCGQEVRGCRHIFTLTMRECTHNAHADGSAVADTVRRDVGCGLCGSPPNRTGELCSNKRCIRAWKTEEGWRSYLRHCEDRDAFLAANRVLSVNGVVDKSTKGHS
jgi:hypothetical protein